MTAPSWSSVESGATPPLWGVWGSSATDVWAVGDFGTIIHWNGIAWSASSSGVSEVFSAERVGQQRRRRLGGRGCGRDLALGWRHLVGLYECLHQGALPPVGKRARYDVWAVGENGTILHWDGTAWSASASGTTSALWGVWGSGPSDVYAVGDTTTGEATVLHWNGAAWSTVSTPADGYPNSVWGGGPDDVWIVGFSDPAL